LLISNERTSKSKVVFRYMTDMLKVFERLHHLSEADRNMIFIVRKYHHWALCGATLKVDRARIMADLAQAKSFNFKKRFQHDSEVGGGTRTTNESILIFRKR